MVHEDINNNMILEPGTDLPVRVGTDTPNSKSFVVSVAQDTPAVRVHLVNEGSSAYRMVSAEPNTSFASPDGNALNPTLIFHRGWRYHIWNESWESHPFELWKYRSDGSEVVLLSQEQGGYLEDDPSIDFVGSGKWLVSGDSFLFTMSDSLASELTGYRCSAHRDSMRGDVLIQ